MEESAAEPAVQLEAPHPLYPALHRGLEVRFTPGQGRHVVAVQPVQAGTVLLVEEPLGWALEPGQAGW